MDKKYQIFVSSTYEDLIDERKAVSQAILECNCIPAGMELFPASNEKSWDIIKRVIDECDYYLLVIAGRYGSTVKEGNRIISYTEKEYNYALSKDKPIIAFINNDIGNLPASKVEKTNTGKNRLKRFIKRVKDSGKQVAFWLNKDELALKISTSIPKLIKTNPTYGWIKGSIFGNSSLECDLENVVKIINDWKLEYIFKSRAEKNADSDPKLEKHNIKQLDGIAFGLRSFRTLRNNDILKCLNNGMNMRLLVMKPYSHYSAQREIEENEALNTISDSIVELVKWAQSLNKSSTDGKIMIKYYNSMTLDFYWRIDNELYVGPYMYGVLSQQTITYKYSSGGRGFSVYTDYFESLWQNNDLCEIPGMLND